MAEKQEPASITEGLKGLVYLAIIVFLVWEWLLPNKLKLSLEYDVSEDKVYVQPKPHDCEWDSAPMGNKNCHYRRVVDTQKNANGRATEIYVTWEKVDE